uniref:Solute carrier organic anion transporter family member n=2 Tax=Pogona vitticeps TaxID=103695 RepID=A0A6J0V237_9SAUR
MTLANSDPENVNGSVTEMKPANQALEDKADKKLPAKTKTPRCKGIKGFLAALAFTYFSKVFSGAIMKSSITQLERRFDISSSIAGFMDGGFELGNLLVIAFVSYFGAKLHRPRMIALGCFVMSLGSFLSAMPHFFMGYYRYDTSSHPQDNSTSSISPCLPNQTVPGSDSVLGTDCTKHIKSYAWIFVLMGNLLRGIGETPITPLGISYLDDFSREEDTPLYIAILHTIAMIGPMAGFLLGSLLARMYVDIGFVDLDTITITPTDSRWVGAWWLGFLAGGAINLLCGIPFLFLPKSLDKEGESASAKKKLAAGKMNDSSHESRISKPEILHKHGKPSLKGFFKSLKRLLGNKCYFLFLCISLLQFSSFIGYLTYNPKYMEQQYGQAASKANFVTAVAVLPAVCLGIFSGGLIMKKYKLGMVAATKMAFTFSFLAFCVSLFYLTVGCDNRSVAGLTVSYDGQPIARDTALLSAECNSQCSCAANQWDPVCGDNGLTYMSACFAGCKDATGSRKETVFHNCSCIAKANSVVRNHSSAILGECPRSEDCSRNFIYFTVIKTASSLLYALGGTPYFMLTIRCVQPELKSLAVGFHMLIMRALAGIPAPVYFGAVIDRTCLKWASPGCGRQGACRIYDSILYRYFYFGLAFALRAPSYIFCIVFFILIKKRYEGKEAQSAENEKKEEVLLNEEVKPNSPELTAGLNSDADKDTYI